MGWGFVVFVFRVRDGRSLEVERRVFVELIRKEFKLKSCLSR